MVPLPFEEAMTASVPSRPDGTKAILCFWSKATPSAPLPVASTWTTAPVLGSTTTVETAQRAIGRPRRAVPAGERPVRQHLALSDVDRDHLVLVLDIDEGPARSIRRRGLQGATDVDGSDDLVRLGIDQ